MVDFRHSCYSGDEWRPEIRNTWVQLGAYGAAIAWDSEGLEYVAQWSAKAGLHIFTEGLHKSCLRIVCSLVQARATVAKIRMKQMDARRAKYTVRSGVTRSDLSNLPRIKYAGRVNRRDAIHLEESSGGVAIWYNIPEEPVVPNCIRYNNGDTIDIDPKTGRVIVINGELVEW